jgi:hypothetical protein
MLDVEADGGAAGDYPQNSTGLLLGSTVDLILSNYALRNLSYDSERRKGKTKGGEGKREVQGLIGFFAYMLWFGGVSTLFLPLLGGIPPFVTANEFRRYFATSVRPCW